ncbi:hypothetical protein ABPG75_002264 [Micractinium tetrahymenae]
MDCTGEEALHACRGPTQLVLGSGRLLAAHAEVLRRAKAMSPGPPAQLLGRTLSNLLAMQAAAIQQCLALADAVGALRGFAQQLAPPQSLVLWLQAVVGAAQSVPLAPGDNLLGLPRGLEVVLSVVCTKNWAFGRHASMVEASAVLSATLVRLLLRSLSMAAVALHLPPDRQPAGFAPHTIHSLVDVLAAACLRPALLQPSGRSSPLLLRLCLFTARAA